VAYGDIVSPSETIRVAPPLTDLGELWSAFRAGETLRCACGSEHGRLALSVLTSPRTYCFQCVACPWQSGWFQP
jgi:hypothetical protein